MRTLLSVLLCSAFVSQPAAIAKPTDLTEGAKLYGQNDLKGALPLFQRAVESEFKSSAAAHYYLGNTLLRLNRQPEAMKAYEKAAQFGANNTYGTYANQVLTRLGKKAAPVESAPAPAPAGDASGGGDAPVKADPNEVRKVTAQLPRVPQLNKESPDVSTVMGWQDTEKSNYVTEATERKARASKILEEAQTLFKRAEQQAKSLAASKAGVVEAAVEPFKKHVEACEKNVEKENQLLESCSTARKNIRGF